MMYNKKQFKKINDKKVLHKIGKKWVTISALTLALLGGKLAMSTITTHADTQTAPDKASTQKAPQKRDTQLVKPQTTSTQPSNNKAVTPKGIEKVAQQKAAGLMLDAMNKQKLNSNSQTLVKPNNSQANINDANHAVNTQATVDYIDMYRNNHPIVGSQSFNDVKSLSALSASVQDNHSNLSSRFSIAQGPVSANSGDVYNVSVIPNDITVNWVNSNSYSANSTINKDIIYSTPYNLSGISVASSFNNEATAIANSEAVGFHNKFSKLPAEDPYYSPSAIDTLKNYTLNADGKWYIADSNSDAVDIFIQQKKPTASSSNTNQKQQYTTVNYIDAFNGSNVGTKSFPTNTTIKRFEDNASLGLESGYRPALHSTTIPKGSSAYDIPVTPNYTNVYWVDANEYFENNKSLNSNDIIYDKTPAPEFSMMSNVASDAYNNYTWAKSGIASEEGWFINGKRANRFNVLFIGNYPTAAISKLDNYTIDRNYHYLEHPITNNANNAMVILLIPKFAEATDTVHYVDSLTSQEIKPNSVYSTIDYNYSNGQWMASKAASSFSSISDYPLSIKSSNGTTYREVAADTTLPTVDTDDLKQGKTLNYDNYVYYVPETIFNEDATVRDTIKYVLKSSSGSSVASTATEDVMYTRPASYDVSNGSVEPTGSWVAEGSFSIPSSYSSADWSASSSNITLPNVHTSTLTTSGSQFNYEVDYSPRHEIQSAQATNTITRFIITSNGMTSHESIVDTYNYSRSGNLGKYGPWSCISSSTSSFRNNQIFDKELHYTNHSDNHPNESLTTSFMESELKPGQTTNYWDYEYYNQNTSNEDYAPVIDTINYLSSGTHTQISQASTSIIEYSRADDMDSTAPTYGKWSGSAFPSIKAPSNITITSSGKEYNYHEVAPGTNTSIPSYASISSSLDDPNNHSASFSNDIYYALDTSASSAQNMTVNENLNYNFVYNNGSSSISSTSFKPITYTRTNIYDSQTGSLITTGSWSTSSNFSFPTSLSESGWNYIDIDSSKPNIDGISSGQTSNYSYNVYYIQDVPNSHTTTETSNADETINYFNGSTTPTSTFTSSIAVQQPLYENSNDNILFSGAWSASTSFSMPPTPSYTGYYLSSSNGYIPTNTKEIDPENYVENYYYAPDSTAEDHATVINTVNFLSSAGTPIKSSSMNYTEYSRADVHSNNSDSYASWSTSSSAFSIPSSFTYSGNTYSEVSNSSTVITSTELSDSLTNSGLAKLTNNVYYSLISNTASKSSASSSANSSSNSSSASSSSSSSTSSSSESSSSDAPTPSPASTSSSSSNSGSSASSSASKSSSTSSASSKASSSSSSASSSSANSSSSSNNGSSSSKASSSPAPSSNSGSIIPSPQPNPSPFVPDILPSNDFTQPVTVGPSNLTPTVNKLTTNNNEMGHRSSLPTFKHKKTTHKLNVGDITYVHGFKITRLQVPSHFRYFQIVKTCLAHKHLTSIGHVKDYGKVLHPRNHYTFKIDKLFKIQKGNKTVYRYEFRAKFGKHINEYYVTGNWHFTRNAYVQPHDLRRVHGAFGHYYYKARLTLGAREYRNTHYNKKNFVRNLRKGKVIHIKRVVTIGHKGYYQTRFQLTNGHYVTANKNFIKLI